MAVTSDHIVGPEEKKNPGVWRSEGENFRVYV
jgi:hypothetical protein